jgi:hypothetical protein
MQQNRLRKGTTEPPPDPILMDILVGKSIFVVCLVKAKVR